MTDNNEMKTLETQMYPYAPGEKILKVTGILFIVHGGVSIIPYSWLLIIFLMPLSLGQDIGRIISEGYMLIIFVLYAAIQVFVGIIGIKNRNNLEKARMLRVWGVITLAVVILYRVLIAYGGVGGIFMISAMAGIFLSVSYLHGAQRNLKANR